MLVLTLRFAHIIFGATWFSATLFLAGDVRRTLAAGAPHTELLVERVPRYTRVAAGSGWLTLLLGIALIFASGGFGMVSPAIHIALVVAVLLLGVGVAMGRTWGAVAASLQAGEQPDQALVKRLSALSGAFQLGWVVILGLMVFRHALF